MSLSSTINDLKSLDLEKLLRLRPPYPPVAINVEQDEVRLVRLKPRRRGRPLLEAHYGRSLAERPVPESIFDGVLRPTTEVAQGLRDLFEHSATRPGRVSLVLPDNLAKITLLTLPERPPSARQLDELVRAKMRRSIPFRLEETSLSYQVLPGSGREISVLVVLVRRQLVARLEEALASLGARPGLVDICTPNLINLCREQLDAACNSGGDAALLNCAGNYFTLVIVRGGKLIFFRCKTFAAGEGGGAPNGVLVREIANSLSYYREKLAGAGVGTVFVRSTSHTFDEVTEKLTGLGCGRVERVDPSKLIELAEGVRLDADAAQRLAPAIGAASGRGR